jgi:hypothetical protein
VWDQHEFFNNAFLMMIAFYFGSRSLEILTKKKADTPAVDSSDVTQDKKDGKAPEEPEANTNANQQPLVDDGKANPPADEKIEDENDPMTGKKL